MRSYSYELKRLRGFITEVMNLSKAPRNIPITFIQPEGDKRSESYIKSKTKILDEFNIPNITIIAPSTADANWYNNEVEKAQGPVLLQKPFNKNVDESKLIVPREKDIDALFNEYDNMHPCTVWGVLQIIYDYCHNPDQQTKPEKYKLSGLTVTVIGRGDLCGKPLIKILQDKGATVIACNSGTPYRILKKALNMSDIVVSAVGSHGVISDVMFDRLHECLVIDVGIEFINGKLHGDFKRNFKDSEQIYSGIKYTPCVGGVGPFTVLGVAYNSLLLLERYYS